jgi:signal transduction histidine kinase
VIAEPRRVLGRGLAASPPARAGPARGRPTDLRPWKTTAAAASAAVLFMVLAHLRIGFPAPRRDAPLHAALEAAATLVALLTAYLILGRLRERRRLADLVLACGLGLAALANAGSVLRAIEPQRGSQLATWSSLALTAASTACYAVAALLPDRVLRRPRLEVAFASIVLASVAAASAVPLVSRFERLPSAVHAHRVHGAVHLVAHPVVLAAQLVFAAFFAAASIGFTRRAARGGDDLMRWLGAGTAVAAVARADYFLYPSVYSPWVSMGDFLRLCFHLLLLTGAAREIRGYWRRISEIAVLEERRRLARELHDGLAQELAFIASESTGQVATAAERALDESRRAIAALTRPVDEPLEVALGQAAEEVAARVGTTVEIEVGLPEAVEPALRETLIRIVREAVTNAGRHGGAARVRVELGNGVLRIVDDGHGFDPAQAAAGPGFGLLSMRERAQSFGAAFSVLSEPGAGTTVEVRLP